MANPRQRRKSRSGSHKPVRQSQRAKKNLKKQLPIRGPKVLQEAWDKHKTVRQNYDALGLVASLNPNASGGMERPLGGGPVPANESMQVDAAPEARASSALPRGFGRIVRDEEGNVVDVELAEDESEEGAADGSRLVEDIPSPSQAESLAGWVALGSSTAGSGADCTTAGRHVVESLEAFVQTRGGTALRYASGGERAELWRLVAQHGQDVHAMARDRKLNPSQRTPGQLSRAIRRAGGFAELR